MPTAKPLLLLIALIALSLSPAIIHPDLSHSDFPAFWLAGQLARIGGDPYAPAQWQIDLPAHLVDRAFLYPRTLAVLFIPLSFLDLQTAAALWWVLSWYVLGAAVLLIISLYPDVRHFLLPVLAAAFLFRPVWAMLINGQMSAFLLLDLAAVAALWGKNRWFSGGMLLAILTLKPQLGLPVLALSGLWLARNRHWAGLAGLAVGGSTLAAIGWLADPGWVSKFLAIGNGKLGATFGYSPTVWGLAAWMSGFRPAATLVLGSLAALICLGLVAWRLWRLSDPALALSGMAILALSITPYLWSYDQTILLLPILVCTLALKGRLPYLAGAFLPLAFCALAILYQLVSMSAQLDLFNGQLSLIVLALWLAAARVGEKQLKHGANMNQNIPLWIYLLCYRLQWHHPSKGAWEWRGTHSICLRCGCVVTRTARGRWVTFG